MSSTGNLRAGALSLLASGLIAASLAAANADARPYAPRARAAAQACTRKASREDRAASPCRSHTSAKQLARARAKKAVRPRQGARSRKIVKRAPRHRSHVASSVPGEGGEPQATPATAEASIAQVLASTCQNTELTPEADNLPLIRAAVLCLINRKRAENGETPLVPDAQLEQAAEGHCQEMVADDYFAHVAPSGETPVERIRDTGYIPSENVGYVIGENLAWGTYQLSTPASIVAAWIASPGHLANILEAKYQDTGIGVTPAVPSSLAAGAPGATYAQEFGVIVP